MNIFFFFGIIFVKLIDTHSYYYKVCRISLIYPAGGTVLQCNLHRDTPTRGDGWAPLSPTELLFPRVRPRWVQILFFRL